jgi:lipoprotein NlpD
MSGCLKRWSVCVLLLGVGWLLAGCSSRSVNRAPVVDRGAATAKPASVARDATTPAVQQPPGFENAGKPGYYAVKPGDTLIRIGLDNGQNWRDIVRWNQIDKPNQIEVGQVLRVIPPTAETQTAAVVRPVVTGRAQTQAVPPVAEASETKPAVSAPPPEAATEDALAWGWPVNGPVLAGFDEVKNKGLDLGGAAGEPVAAAADGRVVYAGAGLRGYGNLIILKHNNTYLSAYAHNQALLVKEDQAVRKGQKIAEMGNSDADRVKLHFEVRRQGKPVDPSKYLPAR